MRITFSIFSLLFFIIINANSQKLPEINSNKSPNFYELRDQIYQYYDELDRSKTSDKIDSYGELPGYKQFKRWENFWEDRVFPTGEFPYMRGIYEEYALPNEIKKSENKIQSPVDVWELLGPTRNQVNRISYAHYGVGRISVIEFHPNNPSEIWIGSASGGAWVSEDNAQTWKIIENSDMMSVGVADIEICESDPNVIYVATGDNNAWWMTNGYSIGILKSTDGGKSFNLTGKIYERRENILIAKVIAHPSNPNLVVTATSRGIYKSSNGGQTWNIVNSTSEFGDMDFHKSNPNVLLASTRVSNGRSRIHRSTDFGDSWTTDFGPSEARRIEIEFAPSDPNIVYAQVASRNGGFSGMYRSNDAGQSWVLQSNSPNIHNGSVTGSGSGGQSFYNICMAVHPTIPDEVYMGGINSWKSIDGGRTWDIMSHWWGQAGVPYAHADHHFMTIQPNTNNLFSGNDGGISISTNFGNSWDTRNMGLSIMQFYKFAHSPNHNNLLLGGTQDNGSVLYKNGSWYAVWGGDGGDCIIDYSNPDILYVMNPNGSFYRSADGGNNFALIFRPSMVGEYGEWITPIEIDPKNPEVVYIGYNNLWKSENRGSNFNKVSEISGGSIDEISIAPNNTDIIYISKNQFLYRTLDGGNSWDLYYTAEGIITDIEFDPDNEDKVWISLSGYNANKVFELENGNERNLTYNLPQVPTNALEIQRNDPGYLFAATDLGVYFYNFKSKRWDYFKDGLPQVVVSDLIIDEQKGKLFAGTFARGIWETDLIKCQISTPKLEIGDTEICDGDSVLIRIEDLGYKEIRWSSGETGNFIYAKEQGNYFVVVKDEIGCVATSEIVYVNVLEFDGLEIEASSKSFCYDEEIDLNVKGEFNTYLWSTGETAQEIKITEPGEYWVEVTNAQGCVKVSEIINIEQTGLPEIPNIMGDFAFCEGETGKLYLDGKFTKVEWNTGATSDTIEIDQAGEYFASVTNEDGCSSYTETVNVGIYPKEQPEIIGSGLISAGICDGSIITIEAQQDYENVIWSTGDTTFEISVSGSGNYFYTGITENGCSHNSDTVFVEFLANPIKPDIGRDGDSLFVENIQSGIRYIWYFGDDVIDDSNVTGIKINEQGIYRVVAENESGCTSESNVFTVILSVADIIPNSDLKISPNPSNGIFEIELNGISGEDVQFEVVTMNGVVVREYKYKNASNTLQFNVDLSNFANGVYYLKISSNNNFIVEKLIKSDA